MILDLALSDINNIISNPDRKIGSLRHPSYMENYQDWKKWRITYEGGRKFINRYLKSLNTREDIADFDARKELTYSPSFAKSEVNNVKDAIFQRISDVTREGGSESYQDAVLGLNGGVDLKNSSMNSYIGREILTELLPIGKVGVFIDMPVSSGVTLADQIYDRPYIYTYKAEDILNWVVDYAPGGLVFKSLLLRDYYFEIDEGTGLPLEVKVRYRLMWLREGVVLTQFFDEDSNPIDRAGFPGVDIQIIDLPRIPFVLFELPQSLLSDVADHQIALLNLESSDVNYILKSNYPFYAEQFDPRADALYTRSPSPDGGVQIVKPGQSQDSVTAKNYEIKVGAAKGRRVPKGLEYPTYISPPTDPLRASMEKEDRIINNIKQLTKQSVTNLAPRVASAESKSYDERGLEAGLSAIGLELEQGERQIANFWVKYENLRNPQPTVTYPQKYSLKTDKERREEAKELIKDSSPIASLTAKKEAQKRAIAIVLGPEVSRETLEKMQAEIDSSEIIYSDADELAKDIEQGVIDLKTVAKAKGYPDDAVEKAAQDHADRVKRISESQAQARGTPELGGLGNASKFEKEESSGDAVAQADPTRGAGK